MDVNYFELGRRIRTRRSQLRMTQEALAEYTDLSIPHISHIETGKTKVSLESLVRIANALHTTVDQLLYDSLVESRPLIHNELADLICDCSHEEMRDLCSILKYMKDFLRQKG